MKPLTHIPFLGHIVLPLLAPVKYQTKKQQPDFKTKISTAMRNATFLIILICTICLKATAQTGNVGIGTSTPKARLHVTDSSVVFSANGYVTGQIGAPPIEGAGKRMMWYADKAAFRAGHVWGSNWNKDSIGDYSFATGDDNKASGIYSTALGVNGNAKGWYSFVAGTDNSALSTAGIALGYNNAARNMFSVAIGSTLIAKSTGAVALGYQNDTTDTQTPEGSGQSTDRIFQLGNGAGAVRSNAITVLRNGFTGIGSLVPTAKLQVNEGSVVFNSGGYVSGQIDAPPIEGAGKRMMWYADKAAFRVGHVWANNWDKDNIGDYSFAAGDDNKASGIFSTALGVNGNAKGWYSFTVGTDNSVLSTAGISMGYNNTARNMYSVAIGSTLITKSLGAVTLGYQNDTSDIQNGEGSSQSTDRIFQLGNGFGATRSNAVTVLRNGFTGIGPLVPKAKLHVDSSVLFTGNALTANASFPSPAIEGAGTRMLWYPEKGAARFGTIDDGPLLGGTTNLYLTNQWDANNIGRFSFAAGYNTKATEQGNVALGLNNTATGLNGAVAMGNYSTASGEASFALGYSTNAIGGSSTSLGYYNNAAGFTATSIGYFTRANGSASVSMGNSTIARGDNTASLGYQTIARSNNSLVAGMYNDTTNTNRLFEIGNGTANAARSNALTVLNNGNTGIGSNNPTKQLEVIGAASAVPVTLVIGNRGGFGPAALEFVSDYGLGSQWRPGYIKNNDIGNFTGSLEFYTNGSTASNLYGNVKGLEVRNGAALTATGSVGSYSDARLKTNITPFTDGLNVITKINPVQFYYKADAPFKTELQQTGIIAQELEKAAPYMVEKNKQNGYDDLRSVNNQAYTFLLINAVKEQQAQIEKQQQEIDELKEMVKQLLKK